jgi:hypothetical protein
MTAKEYTQIKETLKAYLATLDILETLENAGGATTSKKELVETITKDLLE